MSPGWVGKVSFAGARSCARVRFPRFICPDDSSVAATLAFDDVTEPRADNSHAMLLLLLPNPYRTGTKTNSAIQRAIMEVLFKPAEKQLSAAAAAASAADASGGGRDGTMEGVFGGALTIRRRWESQPKKKEESKAFSCMLWCTIALGAMTNNLNIRTVS